MVISGTEVGIRSSLLIPAVSKTNEALAETLLPCFHIDPKVLDDTGHTALHYCFEHGHTDIRILATSLRNKADASVADADGDTALHYAVASGNLDAIELSVKWGASATITNVDGRSPLHLSATHRNPTVFKYLCPHVAVDKFNAVDAQGNTLLNLIPDQDSPVAAEHLLLQTGIDRVKTNSTCHL